MNSTHQCSLLSSRQQSGLTLVEILVALVLSLLLTAGVIQLFIGTKQSYRFHDALSRLQENGRFALETVSWDIRMAAFGNPPNPVVGIDNIDANNNQLDSIALVWSDGVNQTRNYAIRPRTPGATAPTCPTAGTSLGLNRNGGGLQEFIEGVEAMQLLYGVCTTDGDGDGINDSVTPPYVNAAAITAAGNWPNVCSVRMHLLLVSLEDDVVTQPQPFFFPVSNAVGQLPNPPDRCLRQAFSTTVRIRNR